MNNQDGQRLFVLTILLFGAVDQYQTPAVGAADAEIKVPSGENTEPVSYTHLTLPTSDGV